MAKKIKLLVLLFLSLSIHQLQASYCYSPVYYHKLVIEGGAIFLEITAKGHDEVSYVSKGRIKVDNITADGFQIVSEVGPEALTIYKDYYYLIDKDSYYLKKHGATKLLSTKGVSKIIQNKYFLINSTWYQLTVDKYSREISKKRIPNLPPNFEIIQDYGRGYFLLKDDKRVYVYEEKSNKLKVIPKLDAKTVQFFESGWLYDSHFLFDDDTFYLTNLDFNCEDITSEFNLLGKKNGFSKFGEFNKSLIAFDAGDGYLWTYNKHGVELKNGNRVNFYPIEATFITEDKNLLLFNGKVYDYGSYAISEWFSLDTSEIADISKLHKKGSFYTDSINAYVHDYNNKMFKKIDWLSANYTFENGNYIDNGYLKKIDQDRSLLSAVKLTSPIKNYSNFYTYNDKIVLNGVEIKNTLGDSLEFIGSTLDIIRPCDNRGTPPVLINTYYFFKDKEAIYSHYTGECRLRKIPDLNPNDFNDNYEDLMKLTNIDKRKFVED